uniref:Uncharacterized protein n=1 Tax=Arundo donax TaxID=35708 RepID=A0A0A9BFG0_ARUDO
MPLIVSRSYTQLGMSNTAKCHLVMHSGTKALPFICIALLYIYLSL